MRRKSTQLKKSVSPALSRLAERAVSATPDQLRTYAPREIDLRIAEVLLSGQLPAVSFKAIAEELEVSPAFVSKTLKDPVACGWIFQSVHREIRHRLGMVDAAVFMRAAAGDVRAAALLYKRYGEMVDRSLHLHANVGEFDPSALTDSDLDALIRAQGAKDAEFTVKETDDSDPTDRGRDPGDPGSGGCPGNGRGEPGDPDDPGAE